MRPSPDPDVTMSGGNGKRDQAGRHHRSGAKDQVALRHIQPGGPDELAASWHFRNRYACAVAFAFGVDILLKDYGVGSLRDHGPGKYPHSRAWRQAAIPGASRR